MTELELLGKIADALELIGRQAGWISIALWLIFLFK